MSLPKYLCLLMGYPLPYFFRRPYKTGQHFLAKNQQIYVYASLGDTPDPKILQHNFNTAPTQVNLDTGSAVVAADPRIVHGVLMGVAWLILSIGVLFARYLKSENPKDATWFLAHRATQIIGSLFFLSGFIAIIVIVIQQQGPHFGSLHPILGLIIMILLTIHVIWGLLRPHKHDNPNEQQTTIRIFWQYMHKWKGRSLVLVSFITIPLGLCKFTGSDSLSDINKCINDDRVKVYLILHAGYVGLYLLFVIVKEICRCRKPGYEQIN